MEADPTNDLAPGMRLDRYEIIRRINRGGMASVWIARLVGEPGSAKLFALKTILPELAGDPDMRAMFLDEANIASRIEHPNVARVFELGEAHGVLFQVMELVKGESLGHLQRRVRERGETFPMNVAMRICVDACLGLHAAHEENDPEGNPAGIVHRDVSPSNILVSRAGVAKVIDFG
ncbi:MAG: serine/threonine-protein kinase, partial [Polyangiaceae bacterium]